MEHYTEFTGKTSEEAIEEGLKELGLKREEADIRILEEGKKKLFGFTKARVEIAPKSSLNAFEGALEEESPTPLTSYADADKNAAEDELEDKTERQSEIHVDASGRTDGERAVEFLEGLFDILKITAVTELKKEAEKIEINVTAANTTAVIGKRGAMLDAIQTIAGAVANTGRADYKRVVVDCENYRENREATLQSLAKRLAEKAIRFEKKLKLEPMNPYERRIIHAALSDYPDVTTQSEGKEPYRYVVIVPANVRYPDRPASPVRPERPQRGGYNDRSTESPTTGSTATATGTGNRTTATGTPRRAVAVTKSRIIGIIRAATDIRSRTIARAGITATATIPDAATTAAGKTGKAAPI